MCVGNTLAGLTRLGQRTLLAPCNVVGCDSRIGDSGRGDAKAHSSHKTVAAKLGPHHHVNGFECNRGDIIGSGDGRASIPFGDENAATAHDRNVITTNERTGRDDDCGSDEGKESGVKHFESKVEAFDESLAR